jgi:YgiT-type zinc finger domain-containing protein
MKSYQYGNCHVCGATVEERLTEQSVREGNEWILIRDVPTGVCTRCGEQILRFQVSSRLEEILEHRGKHTPASRIEVPVFAY